MEACSHIGNGVEWEWERQRSRHPYCSYNLNCCDSASTSVSTAMSTTSYGVLMPAVLTYGEGETKAGPKWKWRAYPYFLSHISSESVAYDEGRRSSVFVRPASNMWSVAFCVWRFNGGEGFDDRFGNYKTHFSRCHFAFCSSNTSPPPPVHIAGKLSTLQSHVTIAIPLF